MTDCAPRTGDACRVYLVRHGTTTMNVENRYRGRRDVPLDTQGYRDAQAAAQRLSAAGLSAVYAGPLQRTVVTGEIIAASAGLDEVRILDDLNNVDYGDWEGMTAEEAAGCSAEAFALYRSSPREAVCPGGERLVDAQARMLAALALIGRRHPGEAVAAVSHAVMIRLLLLELKGVDAEGWRSEVRRGSITEVAAGDGTITLISSAVGSSVGLGDGQPVSEVA